MPQEAAEDFKLLFEGCAVKENHSAADCYLTDPLIDPNCSPVAPPADIATYI
jgi:hypothetical protein